MTRLFRERKRRQPEYVISRIPYEMDPARVLDWGFIFVFLAGVLVGMFVHARLVLR